MKRIAREMEKDNCWIERDFSGRRIYWCWYVRVGAMGFLSVRKTLIGRVV